MKKIAKVVASVIAVSALYMGVLHAAEMDPIQVMSPKDGSMIMAGTAVKLTYNIKLSPEGNHLHVYVDGQKPIVDRDVTNCPCTIDLPALSPGLHKIMIKEARADHSLTGVETLVMVTAQ